MNQTNETRCFKCAGPYHPATGHRFPQGACYCGRCAREFFEGFYRPRMKSLSRADRDFNAAAATSVRPE
jgi:hypothetical protein